MKTYKPDTICKSCYYINRAIPHRCIKEVSRGDSFSTYAITGRVGLSKDGLSCKYYIKKTTE